MNHLSQPQRNLIDKDPRTVDNVLGKRPLGPDEEIDWSSCGLAQRYPTWGVFLGSLAHQRRRQKAGGPLAHERALRPSCPIVSIHAKQEWEDDVLSAGQIKRQYGSTDSGR